MKRSLKGIACLSHLWSRTKNVTLLTPTFTITVYVLERYISIIVNPNILVQFPLKLLHQFCKAKIKCGWPAADRYDGNGLQLEKIGFLCFLEKLINWFVLPSPFS